MISLKGERKPRRQFSAPGSLPAVGSLTAAALMLAAGPVARADVIAEPSTSGRTLNTSVLQNCGTAASACSLSIGGGTQAGGNLFHRFASFDTRTNTVNNNIPITGVTFLVPNGSTTGGVGNLIVGVLSPTHISVPISLQTPASLFWLSPAGITISGTGSFSNVTNLTLSTATSLRFSSAVGGEQIFNAVETISSLASTINGTPVPGPTGVITDPASFKLLSPPLTNNGAIVLQGGLLTVDQSLLLDAQGGGVNIQGGSLSGQDLTIRGSGDAQQPIGVSISGSSQLSAGADGLSITSLQGGMRLGGTLQSASNLLLQADQGVRLSRGTQVSASGDGTPLVVATGTGPFINNAGSSALNVSGGGRWLIYADNPVGTSLGGLPISFKQYGTTLGGTQPLLGTGNGLVYGVTPIINANLNTLSKLYDGTPLAIISTTDLQLSGVLDGDVVGISGNGEYLSSGTSPIINPQPKDVGTGKLVAAAINLDSVTASVAQGSVPVYGYQLATSTVSTNNAAITPLPLTLNGLTANDKIYDATTTATLIGSPTVTTVIGDAASLVGVPSGAFIDPTVGTAKPVIVSGLSLVGPDAGNYSLALTDSLTASITALNVAASFTAADKVYDGTTAAVISSRTLIGALSGDAVSLSGGTASFADRNVGNAKPVSASGFSLSGAAAGNYSLSTSPALAFASITPLNVAASFTAADKVYDGTTAAVISSRTLIGALSGDAVSLSGGTASFADRNVGNAKPVSASGFSLSGAAAGNYSLSTSPAQAFASITRLNVTANFTAADKVYDGTTAAVISSRSVNGAISGDAVSLTGGTASFADRNVGNAKPVSASGFSLSGADAGNYSLISNAPSSVASINIRPLATWQATAGGNWSDPRNWDALPDGNNVAAVLIPSGRGPAVFDAAVGPTKLQSLTNQGSLSVVAPGLTLGQLFNSGSLNLASDLNLGGLGGQSSFIQSGGILDGPASLNILAGSGTWSGGLWRGNGQVQLNPGTSLTIEGDSSQWGGRTLVVQAAGSSAPAAALNINGTTTAITGNNAILNSGRTTLTSAALNSEGGSLQLQNTGVLISNGNTRVNSALIQSGGTVQVNSGSLQLNGGGSDSNGSVQVADGAELVWAGGNRSLLGGTLFSSSGSGRFRLAGATLTASDSTPLLFDGQLVVEDGTFSGSGGLTISAGYQQSGGLINGFSDVVINQPQGLLQIKGSGLETASIISAPGGAISLGAQEGSIEISNTSLDARGTSLGGRILLEAANSILVDNSSLLTSGRETGGTITIGNASNPPVLTTIRKSNLIADPPATGGVINIYGQTIIIEGSTLNLFGDSGGALIAGSTQTSQLSIDRDTRIIAGPGALIQCNPSQPCDRSTGSGSTNPNPIEQALANPTAAFVLDQSLSQPPLSNDAQTSSQVLTTPVPLIATSSNTASGRNPLDVSLDQSASFSPDLFTLPKGVRSSLAVGPGFSGRSDQQPAQADSTVSLESSLADRPVSSLSPGETRENFTTGTAQTQESTARLLGLSEAEQNPPPSIEDLQKAMEKITQWIRSGQQGSQNQQRDCGAVGQQKCPS